MIGKKNIEFAMIPFYNFIFCLDVDNTPEKNKIKLYFLYKEIYIRGGYEKIESYYYKEERKEEQKEERKNNFLW